MKRKIRKVKKPEPETAKPERARASPAQASIHPKAIQVFTYLMFIFTVTHVLGLYSGVFITEDAKQNEIVANLQLVSEPSASTSVLYLFFWVLMGALAMYLLIKFYKGDLLFILLEFAVISFSSSIVFYSLIRLFIPAEALAMAAAVALGLGLGALKSVFPSIQNFAAVFATAGAGAVFGFSLSFYAALLFLVLLSAYDYIAVFKTKHMVGMAHSLSKRKTSFLVTSSQKTEMGEIKLELGTGDMLMPIVLGVSGFRLSPAYSAIILVSSVLSLVVLFWLLANKKAVLPALPIIGGCNLLAIILSKLLGII